jgi:hypothetical protein
MPQLLATGSASSGTVQYGLRSFYNSGLTDNQALSFLVVRAKIAMKSR